MGGADLRGVSNGEEVTGLESSDDGTAEPVHQLIYTSAATVRFDDDALSTLLGLARARNEALGITGLLLYDTGSFIQVLEGPRTAVEALYAKIGTDPRHTTCRLLYRGEADERDFPDWGMGFVVVRRGELDAVPGFRDFFTGGVGVLHVDEEAERVRGVLEAFREGRWRERAEIA